MTVPPGYGFAEGDDVIIDRTPDGGLQIIPAALLRELLRKHVDQLVQEDREALAILKSHDARSALGDPPHPAA